MIEIQKNIQPPSPSRHPIEEALTYLRDHGNFGDSIVLPPEMAKGARAYYPRVATDTKVFKVSPEGENGAVRVWLMQATPFVALGLVADPVSPIAPGSNLDALATTPAAPLMPAASPTPDAVVFEEPAPDPKLETLRARITELEALVVELTPPPPSEITEPPPEVMAEAQPDETLAELKARLLLEFASLRNMLIGHIPMTEPQLLRLQALEHPKFQTWLQA